MTGFWVCPARLCAADHVRPVLIIHFCRRRSALSRGQSARSRCQMEKEDAHTLKRLDYIVIDILSDLY